MTLQSAPANNTPRDVPPPQRSATEFGGSNFAEPPKTTEPPRTTGARDAAAAAKCNQQACADAYRSFDATDCTYQPSNGPRRLCNKR